MENGLRLRWHDSRLTLVVIRKPNQQTRATVSSLTAILMIGAVSSHAVGPHHFRKWADGEVFSIDGGAHRITLQSGGSEQGRPFAWDKSTGLYAGTGKKPLPAKNISGTVHKGDHIRLLYETHGKELLAKRIVVEHAATEAGPK